MAIVKCANGHHYDADRFPECPYCIQVRERNRRLQGELEQDCGGKAYIRAEELKRPEMPDRASESSMRADDDGRTIGIYAGGMTDYVTGWLVCVEGPLIGQDFRVHHGQNWAGQRSDNDICFQGAAGVRGIEERHHCCFVYDGRHGAHYLVPGTAGGMVFYKGQILTQPVKLSLGDQVRIGNCCFMFVPFCTEGRTWIEEKGMLRWKDGTEREEKVPLA